MGKRGRRATVAALGKPAHLAPVRFVVVWDQGGTVRKPIVLLASLLMLLVGVMPAAAEDIQLEAVEGQQFTKTGLYIVRMADDPVVAYDGGVQGIPATKPGKGQKMNPNSAHVRK